MIQLIEQLKRHEGYRKHQYADTLGLMTIGYGYCLSRNPLKLPKAEIDKFRTDGISEEDANSLLVQCVDKARDELSNSIAFFNKLDSVRQDCLVNMAFNLGVNGVLKFVHLLIALVHGNYEAAALAMIDSKWARQVKGRANELAQQMKTGEYA